jgi:YidC/Oxa1 family membrane protein insertase
MPLFFGIIGVNFQMGVLLYWLTTNVWTFGQQYLVIKRMGDDPEAIVRERKAKEGDGPKSGGTSLTKSPTKPSVTAKPTKSGIAAAVPATTSGTAGAGAANRSSGQRRPGNNGRPANRKRKGGRH